MNIQHLKYFVALAEFGHYQAAADHCHISQPALSMAIKALENNFDLSLVNRLQKPIKLTEQGRIYYEQAKKVLFEYDTMMKLQEVAGMPEVVLRIGVIPTVAPFLVPRFLGSFIKTFPNIQLKVEEVLTDTIIDKIYKDDLDVGILVTPFEAKSLEFEVMYHEEFYVYSHRDFAKNFILPEEIDPNGLWLLEEGHCLRNQMLQLCELKKKSIPRINYRAGSIETLINLVDEYEGITILPELSTLKFPRRKKKYLKVFEPPAPVREVSLAYHKYSVQKDWMHHLAACIKRSVPRYMLERDATTRLPI